MPKQSHTIVVGVVLGQSADVIDSAAAFAQRFDAELICATVDPAYYTVQTHSDGTAEAMPIDADLAETTVLTFDPLLYETLADALGPRGVPWSTRALAGGPAQELSTLAEQLNASMIVVGTRERGIKGSLHEFFNGSVAVQLAHRQHRPVVVIPLHPVTGQGELPWQEVDGPA